MGDHNEHVQKRLRTVDSDSHAEQEPTQPQAQAEDAAAFEHIKQGSDPYDAQTYGRCREASLLTEVCESVCCLARCLLRVTANSSWEDGE